MILDDNRTIKLFEVISYDVQIVLIKLKHKVADSLKTERRILVCWIELTARLKEPGGDCSSYDPFLFSILEELWSML